MQTISFRILTRLTNFISYEDNRYTKPTLMIQVNQLMVSVKAWIHLLNFQPDMS